MAPEEEEISGEFDRNEFLNFNFYHSPQPTLVCNGERHLQDLNHAAASLFRCIREDVQGQKLSAVLPEIHDSVRKLQLKCQAEDGPHHLKQKVALNDGSCKHLRLTALRLPVPDSRSPWIQIYLTDETDLREARLRNEALEKAAQMMDQISASIPVVLYLFDLQLGENRYLNNQYEKILGWNHQKHGPITMEYFAANMHPDDARDLPELAGRWDTAEDNEVHETRFRLRDTRGNYHWFQTYDTVFSRSADGRVKEIIGSAIDITELAEARSELEHERSRLEALASQAPIAVIECDEDGIIQYLNRPQPRFGLEGREVIGHSIFSFVEDSFLDVLGGFIV